MFDTECMALVDPGAARSYVGAVVRQLCLRHECTPLRPTVENAKVANGSKVDITEAFRVKLTFEGYPSVTEVLYYLPGLTVFMVLGMDILGKHPFHVNLQTRAVRLVSLKTVRKRQTATVFKHRASKV